jgi:exopolysaccharide biosynthesis polyprenyl glycosylphosphotransferase
LAIRQGTLQLDRAGAAAQAPVAGPEHGGFWKDALRRRMLATADLLAVVCAAIATGLVVHHGTATALWTAALAPAWLVLAKLRGLYDRDHVRIRHQTLDESSALFHWVALCATGTALVLVALPGDLLTVGGALAMGATAFCAAFALRTVARALWRRIVPPESGLIVGSGDLAEGFARKLALESGHHLVLAGHVGLTNEGGARGNGDGEHPRVTLDEWRSLVTTHGIERVIVALRDLDEETLSQVASDCRALGVKLSVAPPLRAMLGTAVDLHHLAELPLIEFRTWNPSRSTMLIKRIMDVVGAGATLIALSPALLLIALAVKLDSRGTALFRQTRAGRDGEPFEMLKFRTMVADAAERLGEVVDVAALSQPAYKVRSDPRVTRVGRFLRRTSLDELPQLINVLRGEMSLVGPRPEEVWLVDRYREADRFRLEMRPGMTGPMQVHGRGELSFGERMSVEREYVENYSLRKDIKILSQTLAAVISGRGAF